MNDKEWWLEVIIKDFNFVNNVGLNLLILEHKDIK